MTVEEQQIIRELRELKAALARLEKLLEQIALGMGINPHG